MSDQPTPPPTGEQDAATEVRGVFHELTQGVKVTFTSGLWFCIPPALLLGVFYIAATQYYKVAKALADLYFEDPEWWIVALLPMPSKDC